MNEQLKENITYKIFIIFFILTCTIFSPYILDQTLTPKIILLAITELIIVTLVFINNKNYFLNFNTYSIIFLFFIVLIALSNLWANTKSLSISESIKWPLFFIFFTLNYHYFLTKKNNHLINCIKSFIFIFCISIVFFIIQFIFNNNKNLQIDHVFVGICGNKNLYSIFLYISIVFSILGCLYFSGIWKKLSISTLILSIILILVLKTRSVLISFFISLFFYTILYLFLKKCKFKIKFNFSLVLISLILISNVFFIYVLPKFIGYYLNNFQLQEFLKSFTDITTLNERLEVWKKSYEFLNNNLLVGVGSNNWQIYFPSNGLPSIYSLTDLYVTFQRPHNDYLWVLSEYGIIGFNLFISLHIYVLLRVFNYTIKSFSHEATLIASFLIGYSFISFFDFPKERVEICLLYFILISYGLALTNTKTIYINNKFISFFSFFLILINAIVVSVYNYMGELNTKNLYFYKTIQNHKKVIESEVYASSFFYTIDPTSMPLKWYSANSYIALGDYKTGKRHLLFANSQNPYNERVINDIGSVNLMLGYYDSSIIYYNKAIFVNSRFDDPKLNLMLIYITRKNWNKALEIDKTIYHNSDRREFYRRKIEENIRKK